MATMSSDSYSVSPPYGKFSKYLYNNQNTKTIHKKPIFAPILEEPSNIVQNLQELNTSSIPITNNNNNSSFENSYMVDYHTMNKFRPSLNLSCLPPVFEIPRKQISDNNNINMLLNNKNKILMRNSRLNLKPIINNNNNINNNNIFNNTASASNNNNINSNKNTFVSLPPINNNTNYNNYYNNNMNHTSNRSNKNKNNNNSTYNIRNYNPRKKQYLKPIQYNNSPNPSSYETKRTIDNQGKYYYNLNNKNIIKNEKLKEERFLRHKEMSNISINQNKNYVDKNIVILNNKEVNNVSYINNNKINILDIQDFVEINRNKSRVIHIPSLKIYDRFDISYKNWNSYEDYVKNWRKIMRGTLEIKAVIENKEFNCYSVIIERSKNCSLGDLMRSIGSINNYILISITKQILPLIQKYNNIFDYRKNIENDKYYNFIDIDNIWFNEQYNVVLYPGKFNYIEKNSFGTKNFLNKIYDKDTPQINIDLINFGITLININIFILDLNVEDLFELIKKEENNIDNICCLFHYFSQKISIFSNFYEILKKNDQNFAVDYFDFLHNLTLFNHLKEEDNKILEKILNHSFIINSSIVNENSNINELIKVSKIYDFSNEYYTSNADILSFDLICKNIKSNLNKFNNFYSQINIYDIKTLLNKYNIEIDELCRELRVNEEELHDKLLILYENLLENKENNNY
jgi:hypothetical protein